MQTVSSVIAESILKISILRRLQSILQGRLLKYLLFDSISTAKFGFKNFSFSSEEGRLFFFFFFFFLHLY